MKQITLSLLLLLAALPIIAEEVQWPVPPNGYSSGGNGIPTGELTASITYPTRNYGERRVRIYFPPDYDENREDPYPVLYLHHGIGGNENAWVSQAGHAEGNADKVLDYLYANEDDYEAVPMICVMPMGNMEGTGDAWGNYEDVLINDLSPWIEENYHASSDANYRAMAGLSMGAGQTLNFAYSNPDYFTWIGAFSPAPNTASASSTVDVAGVKEHVHLNFLAAGTAETGYLNTARNYHNYLADQGIENLYLQVEQGLNHERENWNRQLHNFAQRIFKGIEPITAVEAVTFNPDLMNKDGLARFTNGIYMVRPGDNAVETYSLTGRRSSLPVNIQIQKAAR